MSEIDWDAERTKSIIRMVREEPGTVVASGHALMTCGAHTGHIYQAIAYCQSAAWAKAIAEALNAKVELAKEQPQ